MQANSKRTVVCPPPPATTMSLSDALLTVQSDAELSSFLVVLHSERSVDVEDVHLCSLGHGDCTGLLSGGEAVCQCATADSTAMRGAFMPRRGKDEHLILRKHAIHGNQL